MKIAAFVIGVCLAAPAWAQSATPGGFATPPKVDAPATAASGNPADHTEAEVKKTAKTGRDLFIGAYITVDKACKVGKQPTISVTQPPANGTARTRRDAFNLAFAPGVPRNKCLGVSPDGIAVMYVSKRAFKGEDSFSYVVTFGDGRTRTVKAAITVQ